MNNSNSLEVNQSLLKTTNPNLHWTILAKNSSGFSNPLETCSVTTPTTVPTCWTMLSSNWTDKTVSLNVMPLTSTWFNLINITPPFPALVFMFIPSPWTPNNTNLQGLSTCLVLTTLLWSWTWLPLSPVNSASTRSIITCFVLWQVWEDWPIQISCIYLYFTAYLRLNCIIILKTINHGF